MTMNTAIEFILTAHPASNRPGVAAMNIAIVLLPGCLPKFSPDETDSRNRTP
jgi:hypothetical protein